MPADSTSPTQGRGAARSAVVWDALQEVLATLPGGSVVDIGGGTGGFAVRVAELGHRVTVVDPSPDALATLARRAEERDVVDRIVAHQGEVASLPELVAPGSVDVVLCHGVLEIVEDPDEALSVLGGVLRPGGVLSLLVSQRHAAVLARAMAGHFQQAKGLLEDSTPVVGGTRRFTSQEVGELLDRAGFDTAEMHAVRVFVDLLPSSLVDLEHGAPNALVELERAVADRPEYLPFGSQLHALATRR